MLAHFSYVCIIPWERKIVSSSLPLFSDAGLGTFDSLAPARSAFRPMFRRGGTYSSRRFPNGSSVRNYPYFLEGKNVEEAKDFGLAVVFLYEETITVLLPMKKFIFITICVCAAGVIL